jgi:hypothetical protein
MKITKTTASQIFDAITEKRVEIKDAIWPLAGDDNRFLRQELMEMLSGNKIPIAKCGVHALQDAAHKYLENQARIEQSLSGEDVSNPVMGDNGSDTLVAEPKKARKVKEEKQPIDFAALVGATVTRKCGATGTILSYENGKFLIKLSDGTEKKPGDKLFIANYSY